MAEIDVIRVIGINTERRSAVCHSLRISDWLCVQGTVVFVKCPEADLAYFVSRLAATFLDVKLFTSVTICYKALSVYFVTTELTIYVRPY